MALGAGRLTWAEWCLLFHLASGPQTYRDRRKWNALLGLRTRGFIQINASLPLAEFVEGWPCEITPAGRAAVDDPALSRWGGCTGGRG